MFRIRIRRRIRRIIIQGRSRKDEVTGLFLTNSVANVIKRVDKVTTNTPVWPIRIATSKQSPCIEYCKHVLITTRYDGIMMVREAFLGTSLSRLVGQQLRVAVMWASSRPVRQKGAPSRFSGWVQVRDFAINHMLDLSSFWIGKTSDSIQHRDCSVITAQWK